MRLANVFRTLWMILCLCGATSPCFCQDISLQDSIYSFTTQALPEQVIQGADFSKIQFEKVANNRINFGRVGSEYHYILLKISSATAQSLFLSIDNTSLDTVDIYSIYENRKARMAYQGGQLIPFNGNNKYVWHTIPIDISNAPSYYLLALKAAQKNINVKYELLGRDQLQQQYRAADRIIFLYLGIVCLIIVITLLAFMLFKKAVFLFYLAYVVTACVWTLSHYGYIFPYLYPRLPVMNEIIKPVSSLSSGFFLLVVLNLVFSQSLQSRKLLRRVIRVLLYLLPLVIVSMLLLLLPGLHYIVKNALLNLWHVALIALMGVVVFIPISIYYSGATAKIFSAAMFVICSMCVIQLLANLGVINISFIDEHGIAMGIAIENNIIAFGLLYDLFRERKQKEIQLLALEQEQAETLKKLITVQDNERKRIAGDLHDNIGPLLAALKINFRRIIDTKSPLNGLASKTESIIDDSIAEIRNVAHNLMPKGLSSNGLINTLQEYFDSLQQLYDKTIAFHHKVESVLNHEMQINLYRIICELALNSARHSNASNIAICINVNQRKISMIISDNGKGFQMKAGGDKTTLGLQNVESRVSILKGAFRLKTETGKGTQIEIDIPLQPDDIHVNRL